MPTYNALGISASLLVTDLSATLSDEIIFRMGAQHQADATRIRSQLSAGRVLQEWPIGPDDSTVGVLQFVGEDMDMALLMAEVEDGAPDQATNLGSSRTKSTIAGEIMPNQTWTAGKKAKGKTKAKASNPKQPQAKTGTRSSSVTSRTRTEETPQGGTNDSDDSLALSLKIDCTEFLNTKNVADASGKDLKLEVFINGQWVDTIFECGISSRRRNIFLLSGTRFHRQAEKPWVYTPSPETDNKGAIFDQRWASIGQALKDEASKRGVNQYDQRPLSAQFLLSLAKLRLPTTVLTKGKNFAVIDFVVTAGDGRKFGPEKAYITKPDGLKDKRFSNFAPVIENSAHVHGQVGNVFKHGFPPASVRNGMPYNPINGGYAQLPRIPPAPQTPSYTTKTNFQNYQDMLDSPPMRRLLSTYENGKGKLRGERTLKQRVGDMAKMSPERRKRTLNNLCDELDHETVEAVKKIFEQVVPAPETPTRNKKVRFMEDSVTLGQLSAEGLDIEHLPSTLNPSQLSFNTEDAFGLSGSASEDPFALKNKLENDPVLFQTNTHFAIDELLVGRTDDNAENPLGLVDDSVFNSSSQLLFDDPFTEQSENDKPEDPLALLNDEMQEDNVVQLNPQLRADEPLEEDLAPNVGDEDAMEITPPEKEEAPASNKSPSPTPPKRKRRVSQRKKEADADATADEDAEDLLPSPAVRPSPSTTKPQPIKSGANKDRTRLDPDGVTSKQALESLKTPELWTEMESTVTYADGLKQRQIPKARGGEFKEQRFVMGMRFVLM